MATRYARTYENGLVVAPPKLDCLGFDCHETRYGSGCFVSKHHLYFPSEDYQEGLRKEFRENKFNIVNLPRCVHSVYHTQVDAVQAPPEHIMEEFLQQASILSDLGVATKSLLLQRRRLSERATPKDWARVEFNAEGWDPYGRERFERIQETDLARVMQLAKRAIDETSLVPVRQILSPHVLGAQALQPMLDLEIAS